jgi:peptidyl-prolyl cis-trans isomerase D
MLEKIRSAAGTRFAQLILALITIPFALWGVESYIRSPSGQDVVADVAGQKVTAFEFEQALKQQQERFRSMLGGNYDPQLADNPQVRSSVLDELINQRLVIVSAYKSGLKISDAALAERIAAEPAFQEDGKFSAKRYDAVLRSQGYTPRGFESRMALDLQRSEFQDSVMRTAFAGSVPANLFINALEQSREISVIDLTPEKYSAKVKIESNAAKAHYEQRKAEFTVPEQVKAEYVELSLDALAAQTQVSADEVKRFYDDNSARYVQKEERRVSHILINAPAKAPETEMKAAREKAEAIFAAVKKAPASFADEAKKSSQDPGSAQLGGDLGFFGRGTMVKAFEDAAFSMKKDEIVGPIQTDFGFHIIRLTGTHPEKVKTLAEAAPEIEAELKKQKAAKRFAEIAQSFSDKVFEQSTALKPIAEELKLPLQSSNWFSRGAAAPPFNNPKLLQALFSEEVLKNKRNTEAVEIAPNLLVAARLADYKPATQKTFESVEQDIIRRLTREQSAALAKQEGEAKLKALREGKSADLSWPVALAVSRQNAGALPPEIINLALKADAGKLPAYAGIENPQGGYTLVQISKVIPAPAGDEAKIRNYRQRIEQVIAQQEMESLLSALRKDADVKIRKELLDKKAN